MFEYALVFEEIEIPKTVPVPYTFFRECLWENCDFIQLKNKVKKVSADIESNHIGLKSVEKMMALLGGRMLCSENAQEFTVRLSFLSSHSE